MNNSFAEVIIIYNPNSTGSGQRDAKDLKTVLTQAAYVAKISVIETTHAGHAEELARQYAEEDRSILLVSASGDGGYNEVVNGALSEKTANLTVAVLPSGNANDHHHAVSDDVSLVERIIRGERRYLDVIRVQGRKDGATWQRYAHSYVGLGLTAYIGEKLTEATLNPINEKWLVAKYLFLFRSVTLKLGETRRWRHYSSVIIGNIDRVSKIIRLSRSSSTTDGIMELYFTRSRSFLSLLLTLSKAGLLGLEADKQLEKLTIQLKYSAPVQCDGEVTHLDAGQLELDVEKHVLRTI